MDPVTPDAPEPGQIDDRDATIRSWEEFGKRILVILTASNVLIGGLLTIWSITWQKSLLEASLEKRVKITASSLGRAAAVPLLLEDAQALQEMVAQDLNEPDMVYVEVLSSSGTPVAAAARQRAARVDAAALAELNDMSYREFKGLDGTPLAESLCPIRAVSSGSQGVRPKQIGTVRLGVSREAIQNKTVSIIVYNTLLTLGLLTAVFLIASTTIRKMTVRMKNIMEKLQLTEALKRSNVELEQFAYVASHDLQEPLRKIQAFGDLLSEEESRALSGMGKDYISRMQNAAGRMQELIGDLLTYSRVTTQPQPFTAVDLNRVVREVLSDLEVRIRDNGAKVEVGKLPTVEASPLQMRQLLQNLIGNALKFHRKDEPPLVRVQSRPLNQDGPKAARPAAFHEITVQDNGIGFDVKYVDRIFLPFQRLHKRGEYEGTGIGLAICRKIVERHGGRIQVRSKIGAGTTFAVSLPAAGRPEKEET